MSFYLSHLLELKYEHQSLVDQEVTDAYFEISKRLFTESILETLSPATKANYWNARRYLSKIRELKIFGFNSEHFGTFEIKVIKFLVPKKNDFSNLKDLPVLLPGILQAFGSEDFWKLNMKETRRVIKPSTVKRGSGIMSFSFLDLNFKDARNFYTTGSLGEFLN